ncbi:tripartite tricarboxylate transporter TctB family protein [Actibacterium sp. 188UL27-1]|uniref:tripartite tricarboxylate transporter TctB family protein n=1 Tax=Actibacterium sp. 188UL27-1 TaxID=2786961 RepID=UPI00195EEB61|nr:tripartite tricarboxylate transporter TctB family protein [Actibacterium sp. 188UL27-1]MBM7067411.1 tripartite tricarboxylate transporter TctB family protein [Actibacterium sp. 188UL27-1]
MRKAELVTAVLLGLMSLYFMWKAGEPPSWNPDVGRFANIGMIEGEGPGSGFWPFWLSAVMLVCCIWIFINGVRRTSPPSQSTEPFLDAYGRRMLALVGGGLIGFLILIEFAGFYGAIFVFMMYYLLVLGRHSVGVTLSISTALPVVCFFFFDVAMRIVLPKGYLEPLFIPLYEMFL